jgi:hypothetical protein
MEIGALQREAERLRADKVTLQNYALALEERAKAAENRLAQFERDEEHRRTLSR